MVAQVRGAAAVALVSNATTRLEGDLAGQGLAGLADAGGVDDRVGVAKPNPRVDHLAAERVGSRSAAACSSTTPRPMSQRLARWG